MPLSKKKMHVEGEDAGQPQQPEEENRVRVKRVKFVHPLSMHRLRDNHALQISSEETITPFYMINIAHYVTKVTFDSDNGCSGLSYHLAPKFPLSGELSSELIMKALRCGGYSKFNELSEAFQVLIQTREESRYSAKISRSSILKRFPEFTKLHFSEDYPQLAEVRSVNYEAFSDDPVARISINKKMLSLFTADSESDAFSSLHLGLKDIFRWNGQNEWISYLAKCFEAYRENLCEGLKHENKRIFIDKLRISFPSGKSQLVEVWSQCFCYSNATVIYYTFSPAAIDGFEIESQELEEQQADINEEKLDQDSEGTINEEKEFSMQRRNEALNFIDKMYYSLEKTSSIAKPIAESQDDTLILSKQVNDAS